MARTTQLKSNGHAAYIRPEDGSPEDAVQRRRKSAMIALLGRFEELVEPLIPPGNEEAIRNFKGVVRDKINGLAYEGIRAARAQPGESVSATTAELAETLAFPTDTED